MNNIKTAIQQTVEEINKHKENTEINIVLKEVFKCMLAGHTESSSWALEQQTQQLLRNLGFTVTNYSYTVELKKYWLFGKKYNNVCNFQVISW